MAEPEPANTDTMYDLASNTKMYAANLALEKLLPNFRDPRGAKIKGKSELKMADGINRVYSLDKGTTKTAILERLPLEDTPRSKTLYSQLRPLWTFTTDWSLPVIQKEHCICSTLCVPAGAGLIPDYTSGFST